MNTAVFLHGARDLRVGDYQPLPPEPNEAMINVAAVGVCGSDLHYYKDGGIGGATIDQPFIPGHEFSGWLQNDVPQLNQPLSECSLPRSATLSGGVNTGTASTAQRTCKTAVAGNSHSSGNA